MKKKTTLSLGYVIAVVAALLVLQVAFFGGHEVPDRAYSEFRARLSAGELERVVILEDRIIAELQSGQSLNQAPGPPVAADASPIASHETEVEAIEPPPARTPWQLPLFGRQDDGRTFSVVRLEDESLLAELQARAVEYRGTIESNFLKGFVANWLIPLLLLFVLWGFLLRRMGAGQQSVLSVGKSRARIYAVEDAEKVRFSDVAGVDEAKIELQEVVDFLQNTAKYKKLGAKLPKGVLLVGPPGTGKTLLARAVAGEAEVPFFSMSGSDFVEMFVGVGAARVRDLFEEAKKKAPCIVFIDELDAVGKSRAGPGSLGTNEERENTLNQLLVEMDGFAANEGLVLMAATNRPEVLDRALLRPGRFDRQVLVDLPDKLGRLAILRIHTRDKKLEEDVKLDRLAGMTPGMSGADLANLANEAALMATRRDASAIEMCDFQEALERIVAGLEKKNRVINEREREIVAYHESGHAIVGLLTPGADPVQKVSIVPRGLGALGYTMQAPLEDRFLMTKSELLGKIGGLLGGRAAEEIVFNEISTGASNDLEKVAELARELVTVYGMSERLPNLSLERRAASHGFLGPGMARPARSEHLEQIIDEEVQQIVNRAYASTKSLLEQHRSELDKMARQLLEEEVLDQSDVEAIVKRPTSTAEEAPAGL